MVLATANSGKLREFRALLAGFPFELTSLAQLSLPSPAETGRSFLENASLKARSALRLSGCAALADDSGLEVDALGGAPGILSARYAGECSEAQMGRDAESGDQANNEKLMKELRGVPPAQRQARYRCVLVFLETPDAAPLIAHGVWEGFILDAPRGTGGFGYDPYFWLPDLQSSAAQLDAAQKNRVSHRGKAMLALREGLERRWRQCR